MSSPWEDVLAEQAYLVQMLSEVAHDPGALEHTHSLLKSFHAELRECTIQVADMERENRDPSAGTKQYRDSKTASSASRMFHRVAGSIGSEKDKEQAEEDRKEQLAALWTKKRTLNAEVKNLQAKAQVLERRHRHFDDIKQKLAALYSRLPDAKMPVSHEEDEAEEDVRRNQHALHDAQMAFDRHKTLVALLTQGDVALINAARHLSSSGAQMSVGGIKAAMTCSVQTSIVVDQAKCILPEFFEQEKVASVFKTDWLADVFTPGTPRDTISIQTLQPHHTALIALISDARKLAKSHAENVQRIASRCIESRVKRHGLRRRVIMEYANADAETWTDIEEDLVLSIKDITVGLDAAIPVVVPNPTGVPASLSSSSSATHGTPSVPSNRSGDLPPMPQAQAEPKSRPHPPSAQPIIRQVPSAEIAHSQPPLNEAAFRSVQPNIQRPVVQALLNISTSVAEATSHPTPLTQPIFIPSGSVSPPSEATLRSTQPTASLRPSPPAENALSVPPAAQARPPPLTQRMPIQTSPTEVVVPQSSIPPHLSQSMSVQQPPVAVESAPTSLEPRKDRDFVVQPPPGPNRSRSQTVPHHSPPLQRQRSQPPTPTPSQSVDPSTYPYYRPLVAGSAPGTPPPEAARRSQPNTDSDLRSQSDLDTRSQFTLDSKLDTRSQPNLVPQVQLTTQLSAQNNPGPGLQSTPRPHPQSNSNPRLQPGPEERPAPSTEKHSQQQLNAHLPSRSDSSRQPSPARRPDQADGSRLPPQPRPNPPALSQIQIPPNRGYNIALGAASANDVPQANIDSATFPPLPPLPSGASSVSASSGSTQPPKPIHGILKMPPAATVAPVAGAPSSDTDPWGVKAASAGPTRPQPKLKTMFNIFRGSEGLKGSASKNSTPVTVTPPTSPPSVSKSVNPRAGTQKLRFVDDAQVIQRPEVDSYPYEDDEMEDEVLPPSPKRGSQIWLQDPHEDFEDSEEGHATSSSASHHIGSGSVLPVPSIHPAVPHSLPITSPLSMISPFMGSPSSFPDYYLSSDNELVATPNGFEGSPSSLKDHFQSLSSKFSYDDLSASTSSAGGGSQTYPRSSSPQSVHSHTSHVSLKSDHELLQAMFPSPPTAKPARDFMFS
ncbi:hypothetical protein BU17DRAFT_97856 [Hysterangium stoloniferum]|nr:hypothetical protein BU17DRAFT_97856 [Hysterangium stoloniferum]